MFAGKQWGPRLPRVVRRKVEEGPGFGPRRCRPGRSSRGRNPVEGSSGRPGRSTITNRAAGVLRRFPDHAEDLAHARQVVVGFRVEGRRKFRQTARNRMNPRGHVITRWMRSRGPGTSRFSTLHPASARTTRGFSADEGRLVRIRSASKTPSTTGSGCSLGRRRRAPSTSGRPCASHDPPRLATSTPGIQAASCAGHVASSGTPSPKVIESPSATMRVTDAGQVRQCSFDPRIPRLFVDSVAPNATWSRSPAACRYPRWGSYVVVLTSVSRVSVE